MPDTRIQDACLHNKGRVDVLAVYLANLICMWWRAPLLLCLSIRISDDSLLASVACSILPSYSYHFFSKAKG